MASAPSKLYSDDVSLVMVLLDTNPFFWSSSSFSLSQFITHVLAFVNAILTMNQLNQVLVIATGNQSFGNGRMTALCATLLQNLEDFMIKDRSLAMKSLRIDCMDNFFNKTKMENVVPADSCYIGAQNSAFLQQASYITGGVHHKPQRLDGLFQYLLTIFGTDLHSRNFLQLPKPVGVDFRTSSVFGQVQADDASATN